MRNINFDYAAGCPVDERVWEEMRKYSIEIYGNPSSLHSMGQEAAQALEEGRSKVAEFIGAERAKDIVFTSGATESNNLAIKGAAYRNSGKGKHIIASAIEHISVTTPIKHLHKQGWESTYIQVDKHGIVDVEALKNAIRQDTVLISVMYANNEIGTVQPIREIGEIARSKNILFHVDATAACGKVPINVEKENIDLLTLSSNDMYGPRGVGALYIRKGIRVEPIIHGGGQEMGMRSGTENLAGIMGFAKACEIAMKEMDAESKRLQALRDRIIKGVTESIDEAYLNGHPVKRLPNNANIRFSYIEGESIVLSLDMLGIKAASGSACTSKTLEPSSVLLALGLTHEESHGSLQITLGRANNDDDVNYFLENIPSIIERLRKMSPLYNKQKQQKKEGQKGQRREVA